MPYEPNAPTEKERAGAYLSVWIGLVASLVMLAASVLPLPGAVRGLAAAITGLLVLVFTFSARFDSYFRELRDLGARTGFAVVALWIAANGLLLMGNASYAAGVIAGSDGQASAGTGGGLPAALNDPWLVVSLSAAGYYAAFLVAHLRNGR